MRLLTDTKKLSLILLVLFLSASCTAKNPSSVPNAGNQPSPVPQASLEQVSPPPVNSAPFSTQATKLVKSGQIAQPDNSGKTLPPLPTNCGSTFGCYQAYYRDLVKNFGVAAAFTQLKSQFNSNTYVQAQCHPLTHIIGQAATDLYPKVSEAYAHGDSFCWSGYYHGVMEGMIDKIGRDNFPKTLNTDCSGLPGKASYSFDYFNCVHGLGHAIMDYNNDEIFDALTMCDGLNGDWEKSSCYGGVFMENVIVDNINHFTKYLKKDDLLYPCDAVGRPYKQQCYLMQTSYILKENNGDFKATFALCQKADTGFEATCDQSLGRDASSRSSYNIDGIKNICLLGTNNGQQSNCVIGAVKDIISYYHSDTWAKNFCASLDADLGNTCNITAAEYYKSF